MEILRAHYQLDAIEGQEEDLITSFLKSTKEDYSEKETLLALKCIELTVVTSPNELIFDWVYQPLQRLISNHESIAINVAAIHTLGICTFYGGASDEGIAEVMQWLLAIVSSDGASVSALNEPSVVVAATEEFNLLCSLCDDIADQNDEFMDTFVDQLHSTNAAVKIAAGETIAHLHEKSFREIDLDEERLDDFDEDDVIENPYDPHGLPMLLRLYKFSNDPDSLLELFGSLARNTSLSVHTSSRNDRKALKSAFTDIQSSVENPHHGPRFSTAIQKRETTNGTRGVLKDEYESDHGGQVIRDKDKMFGSRMYVKIKKSAFIKIDKWWKLHRLNALKRVLKGGFLTHYERNEILSESLPGELVSTG